MVSPVVWTATIIGILGLLAFDFFFHVRKAHIPTIKEAATWTAIYVSIAIAFGVFMWVAYGSKMGIEYFAGYITEKALSVDNLFVFLIIMGSFKVPRADQQKVLLFGIVFALIARTVFILLGAALINSFSWVFYIFGVILLATAGNLLKPESESEDADNVVIRLARRFLHTSDHYDGDKLFTVENGKRVLTPMLLVMVAIGGTDILFALDSIPAIYGLTTEPYIVFTATAFSLMGLRQLYFLIDGLLDRLVYLKYGLAIILGFIGVKLVLEALHTNRVGFINDGQPVHVFTFDPVHSLMIIVVVLAITVISSLVSPKGQILSAVRAVDRLAHGYLHTEYHGDDEEREENFQKMVDAVAKLDKFDARRAQVTHMMEESGAAYALQKAERLHAEAMGS